MNARRAGVSGCCLWLAAGIAAAAPAGLLPLTTADVEQAAPGRCTAQVWTLPVRQGEAPRELMRIGNGADAWARFAALPAAGERAALAERLVSLGRNNREQRARGRVAAVYGGALPVELDPLAFKTYQVTLDLGPEGSCAARDALPCTRYTGTLGAEYRFRGFGPQVPVLPAAPQPVQLFEWCAKADYRYYGMFAFPGWLDKAAGLLLRSR